MYQIQINDTKAILILDGEIDLANSDTSRNQIREVLEQGKSLDINLEQVRYMDSSGVSVLIEAMQETQRLGLSLSLVDVSEGVMQVLELAHLHTILPIKSRASPDIGDIFGSNSKNADSETEIFDSLFSEDPFDSMFGAEEEKTPKQFEELDPSNTQQHQNLQEAAQTDEQGSTETEPAKPSRNPFIG